MMQPLILASLMVSVTSFGYHHDDNRVRSRPIEDLLDQQGTYSNIFFNPVPDIFGVVGDNIWGLIDYAGVLNRWLIETTGSGVGTQSYGSLAETDVDDGLMIEANFTTYDAITYLTNLSQLAARAVSDTELDFFALDYIFGNLTTQIAQGAEPALGMSICYWKFTMNTTTPYPTLPDFMYMWREVGFQGFHPAEFRWFAFADDQGQRFISSSTWHTILNETTGEVTLTNSTRGARALVDYNWFPTDPES